MSKQHDWDAFRYVLDDPTLDRLAFERRMLDDVDLALAVADAMGDIDAIRAASLFHAGRSESMRFGSPDNVRHDRSVHLPHDRYDLPAHEDPFRWSLSKVASLAAVLLVSVGLGVYSLKTTNDRQRVQTEQSLADNWLSIDGDAAQVDDLSVEVVQDELTVPGPELGVSGLVNMPEDADDWLVDAAREFYAQGDAG